MKALLVALLLAAPTAPAVRAEIDQLLARLETSGCQFNRNGNWYPAALVASRSSVSRWSNMPMASFLAACLRLTCPAQ